jgi:hypothetical protein
MPGPAVTGGRGSTHSELALPVERLGGGADGHAGLRRHVADGRPPHLVLLSARCPGPLVAAREHPDTAGRRQNAAGPLVYCFEQAGQPAGVHVDDLAVRPGTVLGERPVTLPGIGQTIEVTADGVHLPAAAPATAIAIPYFQWDNRDGRAMRVWIPRADAATL